MSKVDTKTIAAPPIRQSSSLHDLFSGFFFNHVGSSSPTTVQGLDTPVNKGTENEGASCNPALTFGTHVDSEDRKLLETTPDVTSIAAPSRMRRSETWTAAFQKSIPPLPPSPTSDVTAAPPDARSTSGVISFTVSGGSYSSYPGSGLSSFRKSLTDIFNPEKTTTRDRISSTGSSGALSDLDLDPDLDAPLTPDPSFSRPRGLVSLPTLPSESDGHVAPGTEIPPPASPKSKSSIRRESTLSAVAESDSSSELQNLDSVDINHNTVSPGGVTSSTRGNRTLARSMSYGGCTEEASVSGTRVHPEEVKVPEVRPRRLGILELFERKTVRNKDVNAMAPQSW